MTSKDSSVASNHFFFLGQKKEQWDYNKGNMLHTSKWTLRLETINNPPKKWLAQNSQGLQSPHCYLQDFLITFILQQQVVSEWLRAFAMNWAWKQWNSLSNSSITNSKHKPQARQKIIF